MSRKGNRRAPAFADQREADARHDRTREAQRHIRLHSVKVADHAIIIILSTRTVRGERGGETGRDFGFDAHRVLLKIRAFDWRA